MRDAIPTQHSTGSHRTLPNRLADGPTALFVYGTLQFDAVLTGLIGRVPSDSLRQPQAGAPQRWPVAYTPALSRLPTPRLPACF